MQNNNNRIIDMLVGNAHNGEPGILALVTGALAVAGSVAYGMNAVAPAYITWRVFYHCAITVLMGLSVYHFRAPGRFFKNGVRIMLGTGTLEKIVYVALCLGVILEITGLLGAPSGIAMAFSWTVFGFAILWHGIAWYYINSRTQLRKAAVVLALVPFVSYLVIELIPLRSVYLERLSPSQYEEVPRPGVDVVLGGDEVIVYTAGGRSGSSSGTICFYASDDLVVAFAHKVGGGPLADVARVRRELGLDVTIVVDSKVGVVIKGIPQPENRLTLPLGGTTDITVGGRAVVYPRGKEPYEVTVQCLGRIDGVFHVVLKPDTIAEKAKPGDSGSPVVQNGVIIGFVNRYPALSDKFHAIVAAELYAEIRQYLNP